MSAGPSSTPHNGEAPDASSDAGELVDKHDESERDAGVDEGELKEPIGFIGAHTKNSEIPQRSRWPFKVRKSTIIFAIIFLAALGAYILLPPSKQVGPTRRHGALTTFSTVTSHVWTLADYP